MSTQRILAFLALHDGDLLRTYVANVLWPDTSEERAAANLRSALWKLRRYRVEVTESNARMLWLAPTVVVDVKEMEELALHVTGPSFAVAHEIEPLTRSGDLLPGFSDDWLLSERERLRQVRLHALEVVCERLTAAGNHSRAVAAGLAAVAVEPLRESAQSLLIKAFLAEGNRSEAIRQFERYRATLRTELRLAPSPELQNELALPAINQTGHRPAGKVQPKLNQWSRRAASTVLTTLIGGASLGFIGDMSMPMSSF